MKYLLFSFIFIILYPINSISQIDTTNLSYYLLSDGDYWEYLQKIEDYWFPYGTQIDYYSHLVIGDTTFPISETFKIIKRTKLDSTLQTTFLFERIDSITCNVYRYDTFREIEFLIDSLKSQEGDTSLSDRCEYYLDFGGRTVCTGIDTDTIFGYETFEKNFYQFESLFPFEYKLTQNVGLTYSIFYFDFGRFSEFLQYARIDSIEYGTRVNSLQGDKKPEIINEFRLYQNYPNPFNSTTVISFELPQKSKIKINIFDMSGRIIKTLFFQEFKKGVHKINWDGTNQSGHFVSSGIYIIHLQSKNKIQTKKCLLIK